MTDTTKRIANLVGPGTEVHTYLDVTPELVSPGFVTERFYLGRRVGFLTDLDRAMTGLVYTEGAVRAAEEGYSAAILNAFGDYGLPLLRTVTPIPVIGAGQSAIQAAQALGKRFGILTVWPPAMLGAYVQLLAQNGLSDSLRDVRFVTRDEELAENAAAGGYGIVLRDNPDLLIDRIEAEGRRMIAEGIDAIVLGCCCMVPVSAELQLRLPVPVIDPLAAAQRQAEWLLSLGPKPLPALDDARRSALAAMVRGGAPAADYGSDAECGDACEVHGVGDAVPELAPSAV